MLFERFFRTISSVVPPNVFLNMDALAELDPEKIYVENVRSVLRVPSALAVRLCELAVRQGVFTRFVAVECPDGSEGAVAERESDLPLSVTCHREEDGFIHDVELPTAQLRKVIFYRLADG
jgi:hypothetical protein